MLDKKHIEELIDKTQSLINREKKEFEIVEQCFRNELPFEQSLKNYLYTVERGFHTKRDLYGLCFNYPKTTNFESRLHIYDSQEAIQQLKQAAEISIDYENGVWHIVIPRLPNKQARKKSPYIWETIHGLTNAEVNYRFYIKEQFIPVIKKSVIVFLHRYTDNETKRYLPDTDNFDHKTFVDALMPHIIASDGGESIRKFTAIAKGDKPVTEIFIMSYAGSKQWGIDHIDWFFGE